MKKKIIVLFSLVLCLMLSISLAACSGNKHEAKKEWKSDDINHWHECATKDQTDKLDEAAHTWDEGKVITEPTETTKGVKTFTCTVCNYQKTTPIDELEHKHTYATEWSKDETNHWHAATCAHTDEKSDLQAHNFGEWTTKTEAGYHVDKVEQRKCSVCEYAEERTIDNTQTHDYENFKSDKTNHWFECSCGAKAEIDAHTYGNWTEKTAAGVDQDKQYSRKCTECQHEDVLAFDNTKTNGKYCVAITEALVVNGKKIVIVQVLRGTIKVGENLVIDGLNGTFTIDGISDSKTGKNMESATYGQSVSIEIDTENGDLEQVTNPKVGGHLAYEPETAKAHTTFTAQITVDLSNFSGALYNGRSVKLDLYNIDIGMMNCSLALPEGVKVAEDGKSYIVTITLPDSRVLWAGMEFSCKIYVSASSSDVIVARGIILSVVA